MTPTPQPLELLQLVQEYWVWLMVPAMWVARQEMQHKLNTSRIEDLKWWILRGGQKCPESGKPVGLRDTSIKGRWKRLKHGVSHGRK